MAAVNRPNAPQNYRTPPELLAAVQERFGSITFDAACTREDCVAERGFYYPEVDALAQNWALLREPLIYCNPPFGLSGKFVERAAEGLAYSQRAEYAGYDFRALLLVQAAVGSEWCRKYVEPYALMVPLSPRVAFVGQDAPINRDLMLCAYGWGPGYKSWRWRP